MTARIHRWEGEARARHNLTKSERADLDEKIRMSLSYLAPAKVANYLGVTLDHVMRVRDHSPYFRIKGLRDQVQPGVRRG